MKHDNSPIKQTCPDIDSAISILEKLRSDNEALRQWGNEQFERAEELEKDLHNAEKEILSQKLEISELVTDLNKLDKIVYEKMTESES